MVPLIGSVCQFLHNLVSLERDVFLKYFRRAHADSRVQRGTNCRIWRSESGMEYHKLSSDRLTLRIDGTSPYRA